MQNNEMVEMSEADTRHFSFKDDCLYQLCCSVFQFPLI
jgi:hypothetical protein